MYHWLMRRYTKEQTHACQTNLFQMNMVITNHKSKYQQFTSVFWSLQTDEHTMD